MIRRRILTEILSKPAARLPMPRGWRDVLRVYARSDVGGEWAWVRVDRPTAAACYQRGATLTVSPERPWVALLDLEVELFGQCQLVPHLQREGLLG